MTDPLRDDTSFTYTRPYSRLNLLTDANSHATRHESDTAGNLAGIIASDGTYESWSYNAQGLPTVWRNRRGQQVGLAYDTSGRLVRKTYPDGTKSEYSYDGHGNLLSAASPSGTNGFTYNSRDELTRVNYPGGKWLQFAYDGGGRRTNSLDQLGHGLNYSYDATGRLERMTDENQAPVVEYTYDDAGRISRKTVGNGTRTTYSYDQAGQLLGLTNNSAGGAVLSFFNYTYDTRGRRTAMQTQYGSWSYDYDDLGQLTRAVLVSTSPAIPSQDLAYFYDALGNRTRTVENGVTNAYTVNALNQYTQVGGTNYQFDADGNLVRETSPSGTNEYTYNFENRLVAVTKGGKTWQYSYDGLGNRIGVTEDGVTTRYVIDPAGLGNVVGEYDASGNLAARYDHDSGLLSRTDGSGNQAYYAFDAIGNVQQLVTSGGTVANEYAYSPFGTKLRDEEAVANPFQFVGRYGVMDTGNGFSSMRMRFYDASLGGFHSREPLAGQVSRYSTYNYSFNAPVFGIDPLGLWTVTIDTPGGGFGIGYDSETGWGYGIPVGPGAGFGVFFTPNGKPKGVDIGLQIASPSTLSGWSFGPNGIDKVYGVGASIGTTAWITQPFNGDSVWSHYKGSQDDQFSTDELGRRVPVKPAGASDVQSVGSTDPNEKTGPAVYGPQAFVSVNAVLPYEIDFENDRTATAPAQTVFITDQLGTNFNWGTFMLTEIGFGDERIEIPAGRQQYETVIPMGYGGVDFEVHVQGGIDLETGLITARFMSIDPDTGLPPANANAGFLPPEDGTGRGMGFVKYTVQLNPDLPTGAQIKNVAYITFDFIETIGTDQRDPHDPSQGADPALQCFSTVDALAPTSSVQTLPATVATTNFMVSWSGADDPQGSGVGGYTVYVSTNGGPYSVWLNNTPETQGVFSGVDGTSYQFRSAATDNVGNQESPWSAASSVVMVDLPIVFSAPRLQGTSAVITWNSRPGREYQVWANTGISNATGWTNLTDYMPASGYSMSYTNSLGNGSTFFRVIGRD